MSDNTTAARRGGPTVDIQSAPVRAVWTDFAGVLTPPLGDTMARFCDQVGIPAEALLRALRAVARSYGTDDVMLPVDTPLISEEQWLGEVTAALTAEQRANLPGRTIADIWFADRAPNRAWMAELRRLRARGLFVGVMSNMMPSWDPYWRRMVPADELFDDVLLSFEVGHRKPDRKIFELAAERAGVAPEECVLIDDTLANCEAARAAGWTAVHFTETADAVDRVESILARRHLASARSGRGAAQ